MKNNTNIDEKSGLPALIGKQRSKRTKEGTF